MINIINIIAIIISPIVAVVVGQYLQNQSKKRNEKMEIFKLLMFSRGLGWSIERVRALNIIEIVFSEDKEVLAQWKVYYDKLNVDDPSETDLLKMKTEENKLLEVMAKSLGYKDKITWETIQKPYIPQGLINSIEQQERFQTAQLDFANFASSFIQQMGDKK